MPFRMLLREADEYEHETDTKGDFAQFAPKCIKISTNVRPDEWYNPIKCDFRAIARRVEAWYVYDSRDQPPTFYPCWFNDHTDPLNVIEGAQAHCYRAVKSQVVEKPNLSSNISTHELDQLTGNPHYDYYE